MTEASERSKGQEDRSRALSANLTWLATITLLMLFIVKVLVVAHFNMTTTLGLLSIVSGPTIFFGVIAVSIAPVLQFLLILLLVLYDSEHIDFDSKVIIRILIILAAVLSVFLLPWPSIPLLFLMLDMVFGGPFTALVRRYRRRTMDKAACAAVAGKQYVPESEQEQKAAEMAERSREGMASIDSSRLSEDELKAFEEAKEALSDYERAVGDLHESRIQGEESRVKVEMLQSEIDEFPRKRKFTRKVFWVLASIFGLLALYACLDDRPWLPPQRLVLYSTSKPFVAFELRQQDDSILIMRRDDRTIQELPKTSVKEQRFCEYDGTNEQTLIGLVFHHQRNSGYIDCQ
jgi:hypothetical protein